jgi:hypothetical protein
VKHKAKKEANFISALWHSTLTFNTWKVQFNPSIQVDCSSYELVTFESATHSLELPKGQDGMGGNFYHIVST